MLPESAREELKRASETPTNRDPAARKKAIDQTIDRLRLLYPSHFKEDDDGSDRRRE